MTLFWLMSSHPSLRDSIIEVAKLMMISARTAPKTRGLDDVEIVLVSDREELERIARKMEELSSTLELKFFSRDADNVRRSDAVVLIGVKASKPKDLDCGGCGYSGCQEFKNARRIRGKGYSGPSCVLQLMDLGIAVGSAVKTASILNVDNRIMFSVGVAALELGILKNSDIALGIPLSAYGKNIYFDRKPKT